MATALTIATTDAAPPVIFPARCVGCGGASTTTSLLSFAKVVTSARGGQAPVHIQLPVPHCADCARTTKAVFVAGLIPFVVGFLLAGAFGFAVVGYNAVVFGLDEIGRPNNANSLVLGTAAGLLAGIVGGFIAELLVRLLLLPVFGRTLWSAPLLVPSLVTDVDHVAGVIGRSNSDLSEVVLTFAIDGVAQAFADANPAARSGS